ncbi:UvrD-helicase domain-containing protein [bacterium]|nr:UvrD-helicase domain-containing protein [bacterium]
MPIRDLDTEQKLAATTDGGEVAVSAGAGSGKTRLLVGRYLYLLKTMHVPMSSIVAITFTNKAADQMKARIAQKARELALEGANDSAFWLDIAARVHTAPISTIHSFCNSILRNYPIDAGIDPLFTVIDETSLAEMSGQVINSFFKERLEAEPERLDLLIRTFGVRGYKRLLRILLGDRARIIKYLDGGDDHDPGALESMYRNHISGLLQRYNRTLHDFHVLRPGGDSLSPVLDDLFTGLESICAMMEQDTVDPDAIRRLIETVMPIGNRGSARKWGEHGISPKAVRDGMKECIGFLEWMISFYDYEKGSTSLVVSALLDEYTLLERYFLDRKKSRSFLDHDDTLIETWRLLRNNVTVSRTLSRIYRHILVDEFQDTDGIQMDIIRMISGNAAATLFTVGDPKQSIYRFRGADVTIFNEFVARPNVDFKSLKLNYRSSPAVVNFVNHVFGRIMGVDDPERTYEAVYREMKSYRRNSNGSAEVEMAVFDAENADARRTAEAGFIARRAAELKEKYGYSYGQMAVLLRKGTQSSFYEEAFLAHGISHVNLTRGNPFTAPEAYDIANLLAWLCDPGDPVHFTGLLLSPFFSVSGDFLYDLRREAGKETPMPLFFMTRGNKDGSGSSAGVIRDVLAGLLAVRDRVTIREILEKAFDETGYTLTLLADPLRGEYSLAILDHILSAADTFEARGGTLREFSNLLLNGEMMTESHVSIETDRDALTIISIHKAKGMEWNVVFLADISSRPSNASPPFLVHDSLGPGFDMRSACGKSIRTFVKNISLAEEKAKDIAESKRLFYVGCTRACDHLILSGGKPSKTPDDIFEKDNWMGWLHTALSISPDGEWSQDTPREMFSYLRNPGGSGNGGIDRDDRIMGDLLHDDISVSGSADGAIPQEIDRKVGELLAPIPEIAVSRKPETISPTQITDYRECRARYFFRLYGRMYGADPGISRDFGERFGDGESENFGMRYGQLAHEVLEGWDFNDEEQSLLRVDMFGKDETEVLREKLRESLRVFAGTELYGRIRSSAVVRREEPFVFVHDDVLVRGTIDILFRSGDTWRIVDYKTNRKLPDDGDRVALERYRLQLGIYALALRRAEYVIPDRLVLYFLSHGVAREIPCDEAMLGEISDVLTETIASITAGNDTPRPSESCAMCPFSSLCSDR